MKTSSHWSIVLEPVSDPMKAESVTGSCTRRVLLGLSVAVLTAIGISGGMTSCSGGGGGSDKTTLYVDSDRDGYGSNASNAATIKVSTKNAVADSSGAISA